MAITEIPQIEYPSFGAIDAAGSWRSSTNISMSAVGHKHAFQFSWPHPDTDITAIRVRMGTTTGSGTVRCRIETCDVTTSPATPTGTAVGGSATYDWTGGDDNDVVTYTLSSPASLVRGTNYFIVLEVTAITSGSVSHILWDRGMWFSGSEYAGPLSGNYNGTSWTWQTIRRPIATLIDGSSVRYGIRGFLPAAATAPNTLSYSTSTTYDEYGSIFTPEVTMRTNGAWLIGDPNENVTVKLYSAPRTSPSLIDSVTFDVDLINSTLNRKVLVEWANAQTLTAGTEYALTVLATTTTSGVYQQLELDAAADRRAVPGTENWEFCYRDGSTGAFSVDTTKMIYNAALSINGIDTSAGGGGTTGRQGLHSIESGAV
jgi:hypothetical protein